MKNKEFKVGNRVTCLRRGRGRVVYVDDTIYPITVKFIDKSTRTYTAEGKHTTNDVFPTLLHGWFDNITITTHYTKRNKKGVDDAANN